MAVRKEDALEYHSRGRKGKIEITPTKPVSTVRDLALAYSPGVAFPCLEIAQDVSKVYEYTARGNVVAVISNGTAVLGLGNIGPEASKPVMEGKAVLFKKYADIDGVDIELAVTDPDEFCRVVKALEPSFGGINLEDVKAPECFEIETRLRRELNIPIMHDDQHGTAIISAAALLNALSLVGKDISRIKMTISGAGAAALSCAAMYVRLGLKKENLVMFDVKGVLDRTRTDLDPLRMQFATDRVGLSFADSFEGADVFIGLSAGGIVSPEMLKRMAPNPIVFALANPVPEIDYPVALEARPDCIMATGRSDYPNQVNNVLGFPYVFRGALDVRATEINDEMKMAAVEAIAQLARQPVPDEIAKIYDAKLSFGRDYLIPKPMDQRLITEVSAAVAKAAMDSGVARVRIENWDEYKESLR
ncbi:MAG: malic enzyme-like NAD(P)-binding protein, partial [Bacteroidia bacterium]|nr:NADP-dependent malic enzyme [Bacteroidia bacterium]MDW8333810.1 malic enzyme-like NAD(P)-binding protein [Bacteroidia bacterium]